MTDAEKIDLLRDVIAGMSRQRKKARIEGAQVHVFNSESVIDTLMGIVNGEAMSGMQADEDVGQGDADAIRRGAPFAVCGIGYGRAGSK